ncbi:MAG: shikimate dehydrogenase [Marmoricola sp.]
MRCAVLGSPIAHSLSPALHRAAYDHLGLDWTYDAVLVETSGLARFLENLDRSWRGLSLTMPLKRLVVPMVGSLDAWAQLSGVANTVLFDRDRRLGFNTDVPGAMAAILERVPDPPRSAVVIGGGATATSVLLALTELGCSTAQVLVRDPARAEETMTAVAAHVRAPELSVSTIAEVGLLEADIVVSTVPADAQTPRLLAACAAVPAVFEVVYDPWPTPLARAAQDSGRHLVSGLDLLAHQAVLQVDLMTGRPVPVDLIREAGRAELARRVGENPVLQ